MTRPALSPWPLALLGLDALVGAFLARTFAFVPMWIEGLAEYEDVLLTMLGFERAVPACWVRVGTAALPLALAANSGAMPFYLDAPAAWLWFTGRVGTPYVYRFTGIVLFLGMSWLFYGIPRAFYRPPLAFAGAAAFLTTPNLLLFTLTDRQAFHSLLFFMLLTALLFVRYLVGGRDWLLVLAAYLQRRYANDAIYYTNIGLASYIQYLTLGRLVGADATAWSGLDEFTRTIEQALARRGRRRVFVAVGLQRDGQAGALPRTRALLDLLDRRHVAYRTTPLASERNPALYDIIVVERGQGYRRHRAGSGRMARTRVTTPRRPAGRDG